MKKLAIALAFSLAVLPQIGTAQMSDGAPGNLTLPVYYYGTHWMVEKLDSESFGVRFVANLANLQALPDKASRHILIVENGAVIDDDFMIAEILAGNFVITVGDSSRDAVKRIHERLAGVEDIQEARSLALDKAGAEPRRLIAKDSEGNIAQETAAAYHYTPELSRSFHTLEPDHTRAIEDAYRWALDIMVEDSRTRFLTEKAQRTLKAAPYFSQQYQKTYTTGDKYKDKGKINVYNRYDKLINDGNSSYDWWNIHWEFQSVPGSQAYGSKWHTSDMWNNVDVNAKNSSYQLVTYSPTTSTGSTLVGVSLQIGASATGPTGSATASWTYSSGDVGVRDQSDFGIGKAGWWHDTNECRAVGSSTYNAQPGAMVRVPNGTSYSTFVNNLPEWYKVEWRNHHPNNCFPLWYDRYWVTLQY